MAGDQRYWFPAKRYGWGWGPPATVEGWIVIAVYAGLVALGFVRWPVAASNRALVSAVLLTALLLAVCFWKGEPPRWRWGK